MRTPTGSLMGSDAVTPSAQRVLRAALAAILMATLLPSAQLAGAKLHSLMCTSTTASVTLSSNCGRPLRQHRLTRQPQLSPRAAKTHPSLLASSASRSPTLTLCRARRTKLTPQTRQTTRHRPLDVNMRWCRRAPAMCRHSMTASRSTLMCGGMHSTATTKSSMAVRVCVECRVCGAGSTRRCCRCGRGRRGALSTLMAASRSSG